MLAYSHQIKPFRKALQYSKKATHRKDCLSSKAIYKIKILENSTFRQQISVSGQQNYTFGQDLIDTGTHTQVPVPTLIISTSKMNLILKSIPCFVLL